MKAKRPGTKSRPANLAFMSDFERYSPDQPSCGAGAVLLFLIVVAVSAGAFAMHAMARSDAPARITYVDEQRPWASSSAGGLGALTPSAGAR